MRLNVSNYRQITAQKQLIDEEVCKRTGLTKKTFSWILENQYIEVSTLEVIADAIGCEVKELALPDYTGYSENVIEWVKDAERATLSLSQRKTISKVKKLSEKHPEECQVMAENEDGSIYAHVPVSWIKISPPKAVSENQREQARLNLSKSRTTGSD